MLVLFNWLPHVSGPSWEVDARIINFDYVVTHDSKTYKAAWFHLRGTNYNSVHVELSREFASTQEALDVTGVTRLAECCLLEQHSQIMVKALESSLVVTMAGPGLVASSPERPTQRPFG